MILATKTAESLRRLGMTQLCLSRLARVNNVRLSRFLNSSLELRADEMDRVSCVLTKCCQVQKGDGRLATNVPIDWDRMILNDEYDDAADATKFEFHADIDFTLDREPVLSLVVPMQTLKSLVAASPTQFLRITQGEIVALLGLIVRNPESSDINRSAAQELLDLCDQGVGADD
jgi:hypothetical protein